MKANKVPTLWQSRTLKHLIDGWELIIGSHQGGQECIYWRFHVPQLVTLLNPSGYDTMDCGYPKLKRYQMSHLERYGWVEKHSTGWTITEEGRKAYQRYEDYWQEYKKRTVKNVRS